MLSPQAALIHAMVAAAESGREMAEPEITLIGDLVDHLPIFRGIDRKQVSVLASDCSERLAKPGGLDEVYGEIRAALSGPLREAAYALSCDVVSVHCGPERDEARALERIRTQLEVDPARARTIERAARMRFEAA